MKVLIVDDSWLLRRTLRRKLGQAGMGDHEFLEAENGRAALEMAEQCSVDLILCDWSMPEMNGIELLEAIEDAQLPIPCFLVTSEATEDMRRRAAEAGALGLISKPFTTETLANALMGFLGRSPA